MRTALFYPFTTTTITLALSTLTPNSCICLLAITLIVLHRFAANTPRFLRRDVLPPITPQPSITLPSIIPFSASVHNQYNLLLHGSTPYYPLRLHRFTNHYPLLLHSSPLIPLPLGQFNPITSYSCIVLPAISLLHLHPFTTNISYSCSVMNLITPLLLHRLTSINLHFASLHAN